MRQPLGGGRVPVTQDEQYLRRNQYGTAANLDARASLHARFSTNPMSWFRWVHSEIAPERFDRALDLGCGHGLLWSRNLDRPLPRSPLILSDLSLGMLHEARANLSPRASSVRFIECTARALPFPSRFFDAIIANHMLYHVPSLHVALAELQRVLAPDGLLFASTNGPRGLQEIDSLLCSVRPGSGPSPHVAAFGLHNAEAILGGHFREARITLYPNRLEVTDPDAVVAYIASMEAGQELSKAEISAIRSLVAEKIQTAGAFHVTIESGVVCARNAA
jgi:SAM-dependent methyltransferase